MQYCSKCGYRIPDESSFCLNCGAKISNDKYNIYYNTHANTYTPTHTNPGYATTPIRKKSGCLTFLFWFFLFPIAALVSIYKNDHMGKGTKIILIIILTIVMIQFAVAIDKEKDNKSRSIPTTYTTTKSTTKPSTARTSSAVENTNSYISILTDDKLRTDFVRACSLIEMDPQSISNFTKVDDWAPGPRYSFIYENMGFRFYCNMDSTVESIRLGIDIDVYRRGYEPYNIFDCIVNTIISGQLGDMTEQAVKSNLNYPETADFPWLDWSYSRDHEYYYVSSYVTAQNAFGVKSKMYFNATYVVDEETAKLIYLTIDNVEIINSMSLYPTRERKTVEIEGTTPTEEGAIYLVSGQLGEYGEYITLDGDDYINYHLPPGEYTAVNESILCKIYIAKNE